MLVDIEARVKRSKEKWARRMIKRRTKKEYLNNGKTGTICKCPKCDLLHQTYIQWTGRGMPRIFCATCKPLVAGISEAGGHCGMSVVVKSARKKPSHYFE